MDIKIAGKPVTTKQLRKLGFALVNLAKAIERHKLQHDQSIADPTEKQKSEAANAAARAVAAKNALVKYWAELTAK